MPISGGPRTTNDVRFDRRYPPPGHVRAPDHGGWRPQHGEALPRLLAAGEVQVCVCISGELYPHSVFREVTASHREAVFRMWSGSEPAVSPRKRTSSDLQIYSRIP